MDCANIYGGETNIQFKCLNGTEGDDGVYNTLLRKEIQQAYENVKGVIFLFRP